MSDLAIRLRAVVEERLAVARAAAGADLSWIVWPHGSGWKQIGLCFNGATDPQVIFECTTEQAQQLSSALGHTGPADAILAAEHALGVLDRHAEGDYGQCIGCGDPYGGFLSWPCVEIRALATRYGLEVDG